MMDKVHVLKTIDDFSIAATHTVSNGGGPVLWLHGISVDRNEYLGLFSEGAQCLARRGIDSLRIDFRGHGESSGSSLDFSIIGQMFDVEAALSYLAKAYPLERSSLTVVGCSFGAPPAIFAARLYPAWIKNVVLVSPVLSYVRTFLNPETDWAREIFDEAAWRRLETEKRVYVDENFAIGPRLVEEMKIIDPASALEHLSQQTVLVHGDADSMVPYEASYDLAKRLPKIRFVPMKGMDHGFMDESDEMGSTMQSQTNKQTIYKLILECVGG